MLPTFSLKESLLNRHLLRAKEWLFNLLTKNASPLFMKGGDNISIAPWVQGVHEIRIKALIDSFAQQGYGDFLIDIGANIGLVSCQSGNGFKWVHMYEPNPDCCDILRVNSRIALHKCRTVLHQIGLGTVREDAILNVPRHNWGGAFVHGHDNCYDEDQLASKDGYEGFSLDNYMQVKIRLEPAVDELKSLFASLTNDGCRSGVVKIDVEGCEVSIMEAIAETLPDDFRVMIVFEYFDQGFSPAGLLEKFGNRAEVMKLVRTPPKRTPRLKRLWRILCQGGYEYVLRPFSRSDSSSDIVLLVGPASRLD